MFASEILVVWGWHIHMAWLHVRICVFRNLHLASTTASTLHNRANHIIYDQNHN